MTNESEKIVSARLVEKTDIGNSQLLAIMFVDACGSSRSMRDNESATLQSIGRDISEIKRLIASYKGTLCSFRGDGLLVTFNSAADAVTCGFAIQKRQSQAPGTLTFRVGIHIGDTFSLDGQPMGDSVNVAARIEAMASPGKILVSYPVYEALRGPARFRFVSIGRPYLKNIGDDLELFEVAAQAEIERIQVIDLRLLGRFSMTTPDGKEFNLSNESRALLTVLALSPNGRCSRSWLQDNIWDRRTSPDRVAGLEQALDNLHAELGDAFQGTIFTDDEEIVLASKDLSVDVTRYKKFGWNDRMPVPDLLEGFEIESDAFSSWLLHQRSVLRSAICLRDSEGLVAQSLSAPHQAVVPAQKHFAIGLLPARTDGDHSRATFIADLLTDWLVRSLAEIEAVEIHDYRDGRSNTPAGPGSYQSTGPDVMIECRAGSIDELAQIAVNVLRSEDRKMIWSQSVIAEQNEFLDPTGTSVDRFVSYATDALLSLLAAGKHMRDPSAHQAAKSAIGAVHRLLTMTGPGLDRVEADIMTAYELDPKPVYLAWLAYMSTFHVGERYGRRDAEFEEQTRALARRALESGQHNALVLGLVAHVHSYVFHEFSFANDLISSAIEANPFRSMTWDTAALLYSYTDRPDKAMEAALNARRLGKHSPYRHLFDGACCVAALVNGRVEEAIRYGESVMAVQPGFKAVLRYLAASYGHQGDSEHARQVLRKLIELEPDLSLEMLRDGMYPVPSKASAKIIETGLKRIGLPEHL